MKMTIEKIVDEDKNSTTAPRKTGSFIKEKIFGRNTHLGVSYLNAFSAGVCSLGLINNACEGDYFFAAILGCIGIMNVGSAVLNYFAYKKRK